MAADFVEPKPLHKYPVKNGRDILEAQYRGGRSTIDRAEWARDAFEGLRKRCPHVPEESLVRLFHDRSQSQLELIQGAATFAEYNAAHPLGRRKARVKPRPIVRNVPTIETLPAKAAKAPAPAKAKAKPKPPAAKAKPKPAPAKKPAKAKAPAAKAKRKR